MKRYLVAFGCDRPLFETDDVFRAKRIVDAVSIAGVVMCSDTGKVLHRNEKEKKQLELINWLRR